MAFKQISINILEWYLPIFKVKKNLTRINELFKETNQEFDPIPYEDGEEPKCDERTEEQDNKIRKYQANRADCLLDDKMNVLNSYMEMVIQFGFIVFFSGVFPLAAFMSIVSNAI